MAPLSSSDWRAPPGCPEHIRYTVEKVVNSYPSAWRDEPATGEVFSSIKECQERLVAFSLSQGFDVVIFRSTQNSPRITFSCIHHGRKTRNIRKLPPIVERDEK